jgi:hypothetical protein
MLTNYLYPEELLLEMRIDLAVRDVLVRHKGTAWKVLEYDLLKALEVHKYVSSFNQQKDIGKDQAAKEWLECMHNRSNLAENEKPAEEDFRKILWDYGGKAWDVMQKRVKDLNDHRYYLGEWLKYDVGSDSAMNDWIRKYTWYRSKELVKIEYDYKEGMYNSIEGNMYDFVKAHREDILEIVQNRSEIEYTRPELKKKKAAGSTKIRRKIPINLRYATQLLLLDRKSVNPRAEFAMQIEEEEKEAYITQNPDHEAVMRQWAKEHAADWRDHYALVLEFILRTQEEKFMSVLTGKTPAECYGSTW